MNNWTIEELLERTSQRGSQPGGGGIAGLVAALAASLDQMALRIHAGKDPLPEEDQEIVDFLEEEKFQLLALGEADGNSFNEVLLAWKLPKDDPEREKREQAGYKKAIEVPLNLASKLVRLQEKQEELLPRIKASVRADVVAAIHLTRAALEVCLLNIWLNQQNLKSEEDQASYQRQVQELWSRAQKATKASQAYLQESWAGFYDWRKEK